MTIDPLMLMTDVEDATEALLSASESLSAGEIGAPSPLPGWTVSPDGELPQPARWR